MTENADRFPPPQEEPVESGKLEPESHRSGGTQPAPQEQPAESGGLEGGEND